MSPSLVHVDGARIETSLSVVKRMDFEMSPAVFFVPMAPFVFLTTTSRVHVLVFILVDDRQTMRLFDFCADFDSLLCSQLFHLMGDYPMRNIHNTSGAAPPMITTPQKIATKTRLSTVG